MQLYIVTSKSVDRDEIGRLQYAHVTVHGVFSHLEDAVAMASKYDGAVKEVFQDKEYDARKIQSIKAYL